MNGFHAQRCSQVIPNVVNATNVDDTLVPMETETVKIDQTKSLSAVFPYNSGTAAISFPSQDLFSFAPSSHQQSILGKNAGNFNQNINDMHNANNNKELGHNYNQSHQNQHQKFGANITSSVSSVVTPNTSYMNSIAVPVPISVQMPGEQYHREQHRQLLQQQHQFSISAPIIHNLIPEHLRLYSLEPSLNGTSGYAPALIQPNLMSNSGNISTVLPDNAKHLVSQHQTHTQQSQQIALTQNQNSIPQQQHQQSTSNNCAIQGLPSVSNNMGQYSYHPQQQALLTSHATTHMQALIPQQQLLSSNLIQQTQILDPQQQHLQQYMTPSSALIQTPTSIPISVPLTLQDRASTVQPVFNGVNLMYPGVRALSTDPPMYLVENFLTAAECDFLIQAAVDVFQPAPVVGKGSGELSPSRTSSTCFLAREDLPDYMRKVCALTSKPVDHFELPQVGRYYPSQQYRHHFDAFDLSNEDGIRFAQNGGQRVVTVLVYLNDCLNGGETDFPVLNLKISPRKGTAVVFFPSTVDGYLDKRALHAALPAFETKYVSQCWIRQGPYKGDTPSKRLSQAMLIL